MLSFLFQFFLTMIVIFGVCGWLGWYFMRSLQAKHPGAASVLEMVLKSFFK